MSTVNLNRIKTDRLGVGSTFGEGANYIVNISGGHDVPINLTGHVHA